MINRDFQLRYSLAASVVGVLTTFLTSAIVLVPLYIFEIIRSVNFLPLPILTGMAVAALVNVALILGMGIFVTHRIAGPMYSLVRSFRMITEGDYTQKVNIREGDDLKYVVRNFNEMAETVQARCVANRDAIQEILADESIPDVPRSKLQKIVDEYNHRLAGT